MERKKVSALPSIKLLSGKELYETTEIKKSTDKDHKLNEFIIEIQEELLEYLTIEGSV